MRSLRAVCVTLVCAIAAGSLARAGPLPSDWTVLAPPGAGFSAAIPQAYQTQRPKENGVDVLLWIARTGDGVYIVGRSTYPSIPSVKAELGADRDNFLKSVKATLDAQHDIFTDSAPGIEFTGHNATEHFISRVWVHGKDVYQIAVGGPVVPSLAATFLDSFHLTK